MSLKHVQQEDRLKVSLGYLAAVRACIARGDLPPGQPLYPDDAIEFLDEILKAKDVIEAQATKITSLQNENKELHAKLKRENFQVGFRASVPVRTDNSSPSTDAPRNSVGLQSGSRLEQLSATMLNTREEEHATTNEEDHNQGLPGDGEPSAGQEDPSLSTSDGRTPQAGNGQSNPRRKKRDVIPEPNWDDLG